MAPLALTVLSAALYALAHPPVGAFPLAWVALAPWLASLSRVGPARGAALGLLWGVLAGAGVVSWLPETIARFFDVGALAGTALALAALVGLAGVHYAVLGAVVSWLAGRGLAHPLVVGTAFGACEWVRASAGVENPWGLLAYSQAPWLAFAQGADMAGPVALGALIAAANAALAGLLAPGLRAGRAGLAAAGVAALLAGELAYGSWRLRQDFATGDPVPVALVQGAIAAERRFARPWREANLEQHLALTAHVARADLVVWPEFAVDFDLREDGALRSRLLAVSAAGGPDLLFGAPNSRYRLLVREETNSAVLLREGRLADRYDKVRLMPFSERSPWPAFLGLGRDRYAAGRELRPLPSRAGALGVFLCSEAMYPAHVREIVRHGAVLLANPSNDDWYASRGAAQQQQHVVAFRAIESRRFVVRPSTSGISTAIDPHGRVLASAAFGAPGVLTVDVRRSHVESPYQRWGERPLFAAVGLALVFVLGAARRRKPR